MTMPLYFDYVVVGGGTAGCVLANRLTASGKHNVLVIEAGGEPNGLWIPIPAGFSKLLTNPTYNWRFMTEPEAGTANRQIAVPRGRGLGGSTLINGMIYVRGLPSDYDTWANGGAKGWSAADVEPYFLRLEQCGFPSFGRGREGPMHIDRVKERYPIASAFIDAAIQDGQPINDDYNNGAQEGFGYYQVTQRNGRRWSAYDGYMKPVRGRPNLSVMTHAQVQRLTLEGTRCTGVELVRNGQLIQVRANLEVIASAGAVQTPQLLELSGIGQPDLLARMGVQVQHALPGVGENYIDHFATRMNWRVKNTVTLNEMSRGWRLVREVARYFTSRTGILTLGTGLVHGFIKTRPNLEAADAQYFFAHASYANAAERILDRRPGMTIGVSQLRPQSKGSIHIRSAHPTQAPSIRPNFLAEEVDRECLVGAMQIARRIVERPALSGFIAHEMQPGAAITSTGDWLSFARGSGQTIYHPLGTCRMGEDELAVVDSRLRVRGLEGLRVIDASVMPTMVSGNIQAAVMMVSEKGADLVLEDAPR